jgi:hypothetical protein
LKEPFRHIDAAALRAAFRAMLFICRCC